MSGPYRDGRVHVLAARCGSCIFRRVDDGRIRLAPGRVAGMVLEARAADAAIDCHETYDGDRAICRGFYDLPHPTQPLQVAERLGIVTFDPPP